MAHATAPALDADDGVVVLQHLKAYGLLDAPLEPVVDVLLPVDLCEIGLVLGEVERIHAAVEMRILESSVNNILAAGRLGKREEVGSGTE